MLGASGLAHAVDAGRLLSQYGHTAWRLQDGELPASAYPIGQTSDGYLWIGTQTGVVRYDGARFVALDTLTASRLSSSFILALLGARDGSLWIGTTKGLSRWKDGKLTDYGAFDGGVNSLAEDKGGKIWLSTYNKELKPLCEVTDTGTTCHGKDDGLVVSRMCCDRMITDHNGTFWMGSDVAVVEWSEHASSRTFPIEAKVKADTPGIIILSRESTGALWAGLPLTGAGLGLQRLVKGQWQPFEADGITGSSLAVQAMYRDREGGLWIGTIDHGIYRYVAGRVDHFDSKDGLTSDCIYAFFEDKEGNVWVSTSGGIDRFRDFRVWSYTTRQGLTVDDIDSVAASRDGRIWVGTAGALDVLDHGRIQSLRFGKELPGNQVTSLLEDHAGRLWVGVDQGLWIHADGKFSAVLDQHGKPLKGMVYGLAQDASDDMWAVVRAYPNKLVRIRDGQVVDEFAAPRYPVPRSLASDAAGTVWVGTVDGELTHPGEAGGLAPTHLDTPIVELAVAGDGLVLGGSSKGLVAFKDGVLRVLSSKDGLPCDEVNGVVDGDARSLWLQMGCGLVRLERSDVESALHDPTHTTSARVFDAIDGVRSGLSPFQRVITRDPDGRLWFVNGASLQTLDPRASVASDAALPIHIERLTADGKTYPLDDKLALPALTRNIQLDYTAIELATPQHIRFRYRLDGRDRGWMDAGSRRQAFYTDLPPGTYRFRVAARLDGSAWQESPAALSFTVLPAFYQTSLFTLLVVAVIAFALWLLFSWRVAHIKVQMRTLFEERHAERERIARELHDTFLQAVQGLMLRFQSAMERIPPSQPARELMEGALDHADKVIIEGRDRVTQLRALEHREADLEYALQQLGAEFTRDSRITFGLTVEGAHRPVDPAVGDEVLRIAREAMSNALRHAKASRIDVSLCYERKRLTLAITDDGVGFDVDAIAQKAPAGHWGLKGMHERARSLRARLTLSSRAGAGTAVELVVPAAMAFRRPTSRWSRRMRLLRQIFAGRSTSTRTLDHDEV